MKESKIILIVFAVLLAWISFIRVLFNSWFNSLPLQCTSQPECFQLPFFMILCGITSFILLVVYILDNDNTKKEENNGTKRNKKWKE